MGVSSPNWNGLPYLIQCVPFGRFAYPLLNSSSTSFVLLESIS